MLTKIRLFHRIRKFYKTFGYTNFTAKLSDMTKDNLTDVLFDINEVLEWEDDEWLVDLYNDIQTYIEAKPSIILNILLIIGVLVVLWGAISAFEVVMKNTQSNPQYSDTNAWVWLLKVTE